jgi:hypothetical protein
MVNIRASRIILSNGRFRQYPSTMKPKCIIGRFDSRVGSKYLRLHRFPDVGKSNTRILCGLIDPGLRRGETDRHLRKRPSEPLAFGDWAAKPRFRKIYRNFISSERNAMRDCRSGDLPTSTRATLTVIP